MPLNLSDAMLRELVQRELVKERATQRLAPEQAGTDAPSAVTAINPALASVGGAALDAISTFRFLKNGTGYEDNKLYAHGSPLATAAIGASAGPLLYLLLKRASPKLASVIGSQVGAHQLALGAENLRDFRPNTGDSWDRMLPKLYGSQQGK